MTLLLISPDYASHAVPLITIADVWRRNGHRVVVATGPSVRPLVDSAGMEYTELVMSRGSNAGILRTRSLIREEHESLQRFFEATRDGMVATLHYQAMARSQDLLWQADTVARHTMRIVERERPDQILVDHLAFAATIGLRALQAPFGDVVLGHPTALPVGHEIYGVPSAWPSAIRADVTEWDELKSLARSVEEAFTRAYDAVLHDLAPGADPVDDAFRAHGDPVLYNYPAPLHGPARTSLLPRHRFLGSSVRHEPLPPDVAAWLERPGPEQLVVVSLGTFLSARVDVLARIAAALRRVDARVAIAVGNNDPADLGQLPNDWLVAPSLPQVALLERADALVTHGGNNSVTEALTFGAPMVAMPFSTDQFDGAAAVERSVTGVALDPNHASRPLISGSVRGLLDRPPRSSAAMSARLRATPGPDVAYEAIMSGRPDDPSPGPYATPAVMTG